MMTMSGRITGCSAALFLVLTSVSAVQRLDSINDLRRIQFGQFGGCVPKHSLLLLHWFANTADISHNIVRLTFNPDGDEYGSHHYGNYEEMLDPLPRGNTRYQYYTIGNLNQRVTQLPHHVVYPRPEYNGRNMDRIIVRIREPNTGQQAVQTIDQVYITQHHPARQLGEYDPQHTYQVTTNLLRELRHFPLEGNLELLTTLRDRFGRNINDNHLSHIRKMWGNLACLGLLLSIVFQERFDFTLQSAPRAIVQQDFWGDFRDCAASVLCCVFFTFCILMIIALVIAGNMK